MAFTEFESSRDGGRPDIDGSFGSGRIDRRTLFRSLAAAALPVPLLVTSGCAAGVSLASIIEGLASTFVAEAIMAFGDDVWNAVVDAVESPPEVPAALSNVLAAGYDEIFRTLYRFDRGQYLLAGRSGEQVCAAITGGPPILLHGFAIVGVTQMAEHLREREPERADLEVLLTPIKTVEYGYIPNWETANMATYDSARGQVQMIYTPDGDDASLDIALYNDSAGVVTTHEYEFEIPRSGG